MADDGTNLLFRPGVPGAPPDNPLIAAAPSLADAWSYNTHAVQDWVTRQRAISEQQGLWGPQGITPAGVVNAAGQTAQGIMMGTTAPGEVAPGFTAYHGSPHSFDAFDTSKIGTGEGAQAYGHGLYFAGNEGVARSYRDALSSNDISYQGQPAPPRPNEIDPNANAVGQVARYMQQGKSPDAAIQSVITDFSAAGDHPANAGAFGDHFKATADAARRLDPKDFALADPGHMYEVQVNADPAHFLDWDQTVGQHPPAVRDKLLDMGYGDTDRGADVYSHLSRGPEGDVGASQRLQAAGIPGIRYLDAGSRASGQGTSNHVVFDAATIDILRKYGIAGLMAGGGAAAAGTQQQPSQ
jgi:hypothetical protein